MVLRYLVPALLVCSALGVSGCGSSSGSDSTSNSVTISGVADRGPMNSGSVVVTSVGSNGASGATLGTGTVQPDGTFSVTLDSSPSGPLRVQVLGGSYASELDGSTQTTSSAISSLVDSADSLPSTLAVTPITSFVDAFASGLAASGQSIPAAHLQANQTLMGAYGFPAGTASEGVVPSFDANSSGDQLQALAVLGALEGEAQTLGLADRGALVAALSQDVSDGVFDGKSDGTPVPFGTSTLPASAGVGGFLSGLQTFGAAQSGSIQSLSTAISYLSTTLPASSVSAGAILTTGTTTGGTTGGTIAFTGSGTGGSGTTTTTGTGGTSSTGGTTGSGTTGTLAISSVTFSGSPVSPTITVTGSGFGTIDSLGQGTTPPEGNYTGLDYQANFHLADLSGNPPFYAGQDIPSQPDGIGVVISSYSDTQIVFTLGNYYGIYGFYLASGDNFQMTVLGQMFSGTVQYTTQ
jgi:hypothetical protein